MKSLFQHATRFALGALLATAPANAQTITSQPAQRFYGSDCRIIITYPAGKVETTLCHHLVTTNNGNPNFHFDNEDETFGVTFVMDPRLATSTATANGYGVVGFVFRTPDDVSKVFSPEYGACSRHDNGVMGCHIVTGRFKMTAVLVP
jgi:hypothetical protein